MREATRFSFTDPYSDPTPHLLSSLVAPDTEVRLVAAQMLRRLPSARAIPVLIERLAEETDDATLAEVVETLGILRARDAVSALLALTGSGDDLVRANVAEALGWIGVRSPEVTRALFTLLADPESVVRCYAAESLGDTGYGREAVAALRERLESDPSEMVRVWCLYGVAVLTGEIDWDTLGESFADGDAMVRRQALLALRMLVGDDNTDATGALLSAALLNETDEELRAEYTAFLRSLSAGEVFP